MRTSWYTASESTTRQCADGGDAEKTEEEAETEAETMVRRKTRSLSLVLSVFCTYSNLSLSFQLPSDLSLAFISPLVLRRELETLVAQDILALKVRFFIFFTFNFDSVIGLCRIVFCY